MKQGFVLGKFMPPHLGHVGLCKVALSLCDQLTVLVCSRDIEPIPGDIRAAWMAELLPKARIIHMHREIPQEPKDHPDFWNIWRRTINSLHPESIDIVFGSELYITRLAFELEAEAVIVDLDRLAFPISGTEIRENPVQSWEHIPDIVRPYFQKRVVMFGPESVGKSTLSMKMAQFFETRYVPEYGRTYDKFRTDNQWNSDDFLKIRERHVALRNAVAPTAGPILIEDTDPLLTTIWEFLLTGKPLTNIEDKVKLADLYLLLDVDVPWVNDGTRYFDDDRRHLFMKLCQDVLESHDANYAILNGSWEEREMCAIEKISKL